MAFAYVFDKRGGVLEEPSGRPPKTFTPPRPIDEAELLRKLAWKDRQTIEQAFAFGFPQPISFRMEVRRGRAIRCPLYSEEAVNAWVDGCRHLLSGLA
jgi:hypothetical protein